jgi:hypothetical protein
MGRAVAILVGALPFAVVALAALLAYATKRFEMLFRAYSEWDASFQRALRAKQRLVVEWERFRSAHSLGLGRSGAIAPHGPARMGRAQCRA